MFANECTNLKLHSCIHNTLGAEIRLSCCRHGHVCGHLVWFFFLSLVLLLCNASFQWLALGLDIIGLRNHKPTSCSNFGWKPIHNKMQNAFNGTAHQMLRIISEVSLYDHINVVPWNNVYVEQHLEVAVVGCSFVSIHYT